MEWLLISGTDALVEKRVGNNRGPGKRKSEKMNILFTTFHNVTTYAI